MRGGADEVVSLLRRAAEFLDSLGPVAVSSLALDRDGDDLVLTVVFDHWQLPADLDYLDPRVAAGHFDVGQHDDVDFMVALAAELDAHTVVDVGCGTGQLAVALAAEGRRVIGVDPAKAMLDLARTREGADRVEWIWGDVGALAARPDVVADLIVMTGNIPSIFVTDDAWDAVLDALRGALRVGGHLAFGGWNPDARPWEQWSFDVALLPAGDGARVRVADYPMELADGRETLSAGSEWRYRTHEELTRSLTDAGFVVEQTFGDWRRSPLTSTSPDIVLVARRT